MKNKIDLSEAHGTVWPRVLLGLALGALNLAGLCAAMSFALRNGVLAPSKWYDGPVCLALMLAPGVFWIGWNIRAFRKSGNKVRTRLLHGILYLSALPAGFALAYGLIGLAI